MTNRTRTDALLLAGFCGFLFFYGLGQFGLIGADEPRYAQVAREMLERHDWITPMLGGHPWLEKPPLYYWQATLVYSVFGVSDWAARLPSAIDATLLVLAVYFFMRRFRHRSESGAEIDAALMAASCAGIIAYARAASTDMPLASAFTIAMLGWWSWRESGKKPYLLIFYLALALGMLAKGPVAPFLAVIVIVIYAAAVRQIRLIAKTLWLPGILFSCAVALPWYIVVQIHNPQFVREFIIEQNLGRFSQNLYHHSGPLGYYFPVTALALWPWTIFVAVALFQVVQLWRMNRSVVRATPTDSTAELGIFAGFWLLVPVIFFSISRSKLPGYILPGVPAGALLLANYLQRQFAQHKEKPVPVWLALLHSLFAVAPIVPALLIAYLLTRHRLPGGKPMLVTLAVAFALCAGIALTLVRKSGLRMLRFVTLIPVVLTVAAALKLGSVDLDQALSARPLAQEIAAIETHPLPLAVYHIRRELEYGLTFYRNRLTFNYDWGSVPREEHLLVAPENSQAEVAKLVPGRRVSYLGHYAAQHVDYFWVAAANSTR
jgi:4-amino-4-deoxy-L-arabinose transferase-like glycosyltransferase